MRVLSVWDNGGETADRYTVLYSGRGTLRTDSKGNKWRACRSMSERPCHPQGFGQWGEGMPGRHLGKRIRLEDLPDACRSLVARDLAG
jgi:hypothetical protein